MIYDTIIKSVPIDKGWSADKKYHVWDRNGRDYLMRISSEEKAGRKSKSFEMMKILAQKGIPMSAPIEFGRCREGVYSLLQWINGKDASDVIPALPFSRQYEYGYEAGRILKRIHCIPAPETQTPWDVRFNAKMDKKIKMYNDCALKYENGERFIEYISENRRLLTARPQFYQHGDYHIGNMMIDNSSKIVIIDFDRDDFGDPWEEFNRIVWCVQEGSDIFASGIVDGYFECCIPEEFWRLLALYISSNTLSSLPWAIPFGADEVQTMSEQAREVLVWYDYMNNFVPLWYKGKSK